jgi:mannose/fructose-specific phosphotransferase system component IIA
MWSHDQINHGLHEMFRQIYVMRQMLRLPAADRTNEARTAFEESFDECAESLILTDLMGLDWHAPELAAK